MTIKIFTKNNCMQCKMAKRRMTDLGINYEEINVDSHPEIIDYIKNDIGFQSLPVTIAGDKSWCGFKPTDIQKIAFN